MGFPFDQYGRYSLVRDCVSGVRTVLGGERLRLLDVGGYFQAASGAVRFPIRMMLPDDDTVVVDVMTGERIDARDRGGYVCASGLDLPFADGSFDVVVSCDALEHVPARDRPRFVAELARVARRYVLLTAPMASPNAVLAERIVGEFVRLRLGQPQRQLLEHSLNGLPRAEDVLLALEQVGLSCVSFPSEDLHGWLFMMLAKHYLMPLPSSQELHELVDQFYCQSFSQGPLPESASGWSYRRFFVASKVPGDPFLAGLAEKLPHQAANHGADGVGAGGTAELGFQLSRLLLALTTREIVPGDGENIDIAIYGGRATVGELGGDRTVGQSFVSHRANLCRIDLLLGTYGRMNPGTVRLRLHEGSPDGPEVACVTVEAASIFDSKWHTFRFPPQLQSQNRAYYFELAHEGGTSGGAITSYYNPSLRLGSMTRYENRRPAGGQLAFRTYFVPLTTEEERLAELERLRGEHAYTLQYLDECQHQLQFLKSWPSYRVEGWLRRLLRRPV